MMSSRNTSIIRHETGQKFVFSTGLLIKAALDKTKPAHAMSYGNWL